MGIDPGKEKGPEIGVRLGNFYRSASVKFLIHSVANLIFLILFAYHICSVDPVPWASGLETHPR